MAGWFQRCGKMLISENSVTENELDAEVVGGASKMRQE
jgi:hypothetical protein